MKTTSTLTALAITLSSLASARRDTDCPCLTADACEAASAGQYEHFYNNPQFQTKGCYTKEGSGKAFFSLGQPESMSEESLPGVQTRIWCACEDDSNDLVSIQDFLPVDTSGSSGGSGRDKETADRDFPINYFDEREGIEGIEDTDSAAATSGMISFGVAAAVVTASLFF